MDMPHKVAAFWRKHVETDARFQPDKEQLYVFLLNMRCRLIGFELVTVGCLHTAYVYPPEVFRAAVAMGAAAVVLAHNHPTGDPSPSEADIVATRRLIRAGHVMQIDVRDHVIFSSPRQGRRVNYLSLSELGYFYADDASEPVKQPGTPLPQLAA